MKKRLVSYVLAACVLSTTPGQAAGFKVGDVDLTLGGSAILDAGWKRSDLGSVPQDSGQEDTRLDWFTEIPSNCRLSLKAVYENMTGYVEVGLGSSGVSTRHIYAAYAMDAANTLLIGQTNSLLSEASPGQKLNNDGKLEGFGNLYAGRKPQLRFTHRQGDSLSFSLALEDNRSAMSSGVASGSHIDEQTMPAIMAAVAYKNAGLTIVPSAYFQRYTLKQNDALATTEDVMLSSWALALNGAYKTDIATLSMEAWYGSNLSAIGIDKRPTQPNGTTKPSMVMGAPVADESGNDVKDVTSMGGWVQVSVPVETAMINIGAGYQRSDVENTPSELYETEVETMGAFANVAFAIAKGFTVQPEIAWFDHGNDARKTLSASGVSYAEGDNTLGTDLYFGIHFQYDF
ncbi:MAG: hypothetical protein ABFD81_03750 [Syntrophaceae bacterium]